ncbi:MAG: RluA family pseudouridine synthase, partial [Bacteroidota bacterium]
NLVKLKPKTGRRHQLRIQLAGMDNPILGDKDYGIEHLILKGKGMYLHAYSLSFKHPITGEKFVIRDELPARFQKIFPELGEGL